MEICILPMRGGGGKEDRRVIRTHSEDPREGQLLPGDLVSQGPAPCL